MFRLFAFIIVFVMGMAVSSEISMLVEVQTLAEGSWWKVFVYSGLSIVVSACTAINPRQ